MSRIEERNGLTVEGRLRLIESDLDKIDARLGKIYAALSVAATGLVTSTILLAVQQGVGS